MTLKEFWKKHKHKLLAGGLIIGGIAVIVAVIKGKSAKNVVDLTGKSIIYWDPQSKDFMNLERVKEILDLNATNSSGFAIFREGSNPNEYICILTDAAEFVASK